MPYIKQEQRAKYEKIFDELFEKEVEASGNLNYLISMICKQYIREKGVKYKTFNEVVGALECAKLELYRTKIAPYEERKITENGDI